MSGDQDPTRGEVKAVVSLVIRRVAKEHTTSRIGYQLVASRCGGVGVTRTSKDTEVVVVRRGTEEGVVRSGSWGGSGGETVE